MYTEVMRRVVDLVGIEPTTSSMPWNLKNRILLTAKTLRVGRVDKNRKNRRVLTPNLTPNWAGADSGGSALFSSKENNNLRKSTSDCDYRSRPMFPVFPLPVVLPKYHAAAHGASLRKRRRGLGSKREWST